MNANSWGSFFIYLVIVLGLQIGLQYGLYYLGVSTIWVNIIIDLVISVVFSLFRFRGREKLKNPDFHKSIAIYFAIFTLITVLFNYIF